MKILSCCFTDFVLHPNTNKVELKGHLIKSTMKMLRFCFEIKYKEIYTLYKQKYGVYLL